MKITVELKHPDDVTDEEGVAQTIFDAFKNQVGGPVKKVTIDYVTHWNPERGGDDD